MSFTVVCHYGDGARSLSAIVDSLIMTTDEAAARGYAELNRVWKITDTYNVKLPAFEGSHVLEVGKFITFTCPELGFIDRSLYVANVEQNGKEGSTVIDVVFEEYEDFEAARA